MVRHGSRRADQWLVMQVRLVTPSTSEDYVTCELWSNATLEACPWHPQGGCGFARHGTYQRVKPVNTHVARWYCRKAGHTVSALPDCLASHRSGTLDECEALVRVVEMAPSLEVACRELRTDIELPGAQRYVTRVARAVHAALKIIKGLFPTRFINEPTLTDFARVIDTPNVLMALRDIASRYLPELPTPLGFNPPPLSVQSPATPVQHRMGHDPPVALIKDSRAQPMGL